MAEHHDHIRLRGHFSINPANRFSRVLEAQPLGSLDDGDEGGLGCGYTDHTDGHARHFKESVRLHRDGRAGSGGEGGRRPGGVIAHPAFALHRHVGCKEGVLCLFKSVGQNGLAPVKLVIAKSRRVVTDGVEVINRGDAVGQIGKQGTLHLVAGVQQQYVISAHFVAHSVDHGCNAGRARVGACRFQVAVKVIGVQDGERRSFHLGGRPPRQEQAQDHHQNDEFAELILHLISLFYRSESCIANGPICRSAIHVSWGQYTSLRLMAAGGGSQR